MLLALALIPVIVLLIVIYFNDKNEKEPAGLLTGLFFAGVGSIIPAIIVEGICQFVLDQIVPYDSMIKQYFLAIVIIGPAEELSKYAVLRLITWKNKHFNYSYDAIVYAVFVSLGFAALENIGYVFSYGLGTAILRMFTAIPGHACFAVFMGYFYSKAKYAFITRNRKDYHKYNLLSLIVPILVHGVYDAIVLGGRASGVDIITGLSALLWIGYVIAMFTVSIIIVVKSSKNDYLIVTLPDSVQTVYRPKIAGSWSCSCGSVNYFNFCSECGRQRPMVSTWNCPKCGTLSTFNFCGNCGCQRPSAPVDQTYHA